MTLGGDAGGGNVNGGLSLDVGMGYEISETENLQLEVDSISLVPVDESVYKFKLHLGAHVEGREILSRAKILSRTDFGEWEFLIDDCIEDPKTITNPRVNLVQLQDLPKLITENDLRGDRGPESDYWSSSNIRKNFQVYTKGEGEELPCFVLCLNRNVSTDEVYNDSPLYSAGKLSAKFGGIVTSVGIAVDFLGSGLPWWQVALAGVSSAGVGFVFGYKDSKNKKSNIDECVNVEDVEEFVDFEEEKGFIEQPWFYDSIFTIIDPERSYDELEFVVNVGLRYRLWHGLFGGNVKDKKDIGFRLVNGCYSDFVQTIESISWNDEGGPYR